MRQLRLIRCSLCVLAVTIAASLVLADPNDWVNINYVVQQNGGGAADTAGARQSILSKAANTAKGGPWSIVTNNNVKPPSGDVHDYLSWAPYHWPACDWCSKGTNHLSGPSSTNSTDTDSGDDGDDYPSDDDPYGEDGGADDDAYELNVLNNLSALRRANGHGAIHGRAHRRMIRRKRDLLEQIRSQDTLARRQDSSVQDGTASQEDAILPATDIPAVPTSLPTGVLPTGTSSASSSVKTINGTPAPAQAPAKTTASKCTPSPTKSLAPSATWTTCPYVVRDGKVNPDVRSLPDSEAAVSMSQSVLYNALAYGVARTRGYSQNVAKFVDAFFLTSATAMNPNVNYGQQVRGPGKAHQMGTYTGILDLRGLVKVVNAIQILKASASPDWTSARDKAMSNWMIAYVAWLENSSLGQQVAKKANNHLTFYVNQLAATKMFVGDAQGAQTALKNYFTNQFLDQIAASGEQPFEAVRTRPYHYRCFNLEAMITNAKLGDQLGMNFWTAKSKYGATIQTALDYTMSLDPKGENIDDIFPHVAAVAAAYGDPQGKYAAFLQKQDSNYANQPFWFYDQSNALPNSPAGGRSKYRRDNVDALVDGGAANTTASLVKNASDAAQGATAQTLAEVNSGGVDFACPAVFQYEEETELEDELFTTCDELKPFYELFDF
ncbi:alginate lyase-domain-containing protein [Trametes meyenii]|nr:alginate lyase-domain-containing protein [Trametes meyenii]